MPGIFMVAVSPRDKTVLEKHLATRKKKKAEWKRSVIAQAWDCIHSGMESNGGTSV